MTDSQPHGDAATSAPITGATQGTADVLAKLRQLLAGTLPLGGGNTLYATGPLQVQLSLVGDAIRIQLGKPYPQVKAQLFPMKFNITGGVIRGTKLELEVSGLPNPVIDLE